MAVMVDFAQVVFVLKTGRETTEDHLLRTSTAGRCPAEGCVETGQ